LDLHAALGGRARPAARRRPSPRWFAGGRDEQHRRPRRARSRRRPPAALRAVNAVRAPEVDASGARTAGTGSRWTRGAESAGGSAVVRAGPRVVALGARQALGLAAHEQDDDDDDRHPADGEQHDHRGRHAGIAAGRLTDLAALLGVLARFVDATASESGLRRLLGRFLDVAAGAFGVLDRERVVSGDRVAVLGHHPPGHLVVAGLEVIGQGDLQLLALDGQLTGGDVVAVDDDGDLGADLLDLTGEGHLEPLRLL